MALYRHDPAKPVRLRIFSPLGFYPRNAIEIGGARLLIEADLVASAVQFESPEVHGFGDEHFSDLEFLTVEETRFLASLALAVHPHDGMVYAYPLRGHADVAFGLDNRALLEAARQHASEATRKGWWSPGAVLPACCGGPAYQWREAGVDTAQVVEVARGIELSNHLLMRGVGALLRAQMCWQHYEIAEAAVIQLYVALDVSFQMILQSLQKRGVSNPSALDAGALIDEVFNPGEEGGSYFESYYPARIKTMHPSSRFGVFGVAPLEADDYYHLRHDLVEVYHWLITGRRLEPRAT